MLLTLDYWTIILQEHLMYIMGSMYSSLQAKKIQRDLDETKIILVSVSDLIFFLDA